MKRFLKPLLIILAILILTLSVSAQDLYGTYDQRIKITIDHDDIDSNLTWFPVTVHLTDSQGEEVFTEFDADEDFDRIAFTMSDGVTQLYADCELFDDSEQKAIYHVSKTGWTVSSSTDTDIYLYFDNDAGHNTQYIGKAGSYPEIDWTTEYDGSVEPDSDGWTLGGNDYASSDGDILTIDTTGDGNRTCYYYKEPDVDFDAGVYIRTKVKIHTDSGSAASFRMKFYDGTQEEYFSVYIKETSLSYYGDTSTKTIYGMTNNDDYHIFEMYVKNTTFYIYKDGRLLATDEVSPTVHDDSIEFGDMYSDYNATLECMVDYFNYDLGLSYNPCAVYTNVWDSNFKAVYHMNDNTTSTILDATSNANDGTKKGSGEPAEATGKVGQGQDFDGSNDYIKIYNSGELIAQDEITVEALVSFGTLPSDKGAWETIYAQNDETNGFVTHHFFVTNATDKQGYDNFQPSGSQVYGTNAVASASTWYHLAFTREAAGTGDTVSHYKDGSANGTGEADARSDAAAIDYTLLGARYHTSAAQQPFVGIMDEVRISNVERSAAWIAATYDSLFDTLLTYGSEETEEAGTTTNVLFVFSNL